MFAILIICASLATIIAVPNRSDTSPTVTLLENEPKPVVISSDPVQEILTPKVAQSEVDSKDGNVAKETVLDSTFPEQAERLDSETAKESDRRVDKPKGLLASALQPFALRPAALPPPPPPPPAPTSRPIYIINLDHVVFNSSLSNSFTNSTVDGNNEN